MVRISRFQFYYFIIIFCFEFTLVCVPNSTPIFSHCSQFPWLQVLLIEFKNNSLTWEDRGWGSFAWIRLHSTIKTLEYGCALLTNFYLSSAGLFSTTSSLLCNLFASVWRICVVFFLHFLVSIFRFERIHGKEGGSRESINVFRIKNERIHEALFLKLRLRVL